ncbi:MAG: tRNA/rRNA cytosine-C5-methylase [Actinobacteria bacterium]|nr:tRNA/rRNA cytosine-C5-methylase [Actinomycetota bacterium]
MGSWSTNPTGSEFRLRQSGARKTAFEVLYEVNFNNQYSNILLSKIFREIELSERDRGFVTELVYGTLRNRARCDGAIRRTSDRPFTEIDPKVLEVLRLAAYQILFLSSPAHAAVNESVELAKVVAGKSSAGFVNAVSRRIAELGDYSLEGIEEEYSHPSWMINAFQDALKDETKLRLQLEADNKAQSVTLIAWPGRSTVDELIDLGGVRIERGENAVRFAGNPGSLAAIRERRAGVQEVGSQLVVERFFETDTGDLRWLDLCAGPGGKAAYLDSLIRNGEFIANEISSERAKLVQQVVLRGKVTSFDGTRIPESMGDFDRILIDAPCTGIGALRRRPEIRWRRTPSDLQELVLLQAKLLESASKHLKLGGIIGYATCSPHLAETKWQLRDFLRRNPNYKRVRVTGDADEDGDLQLWTYKDDTDSMYLSLVRRES